MSTPIKRRKVKTVEGGQYFSAPPPLEFIPSGSTLLDCVIGGGYPLGRMVNIVGDKSTGKTLLAMEAIANFFLLYPQGSAYYLEAEAAFDETYAQALGIPMKRVKLIEDINTIEGFHDDLERVCKSAVGNPALYIVDSLDALSAKAELDRKISDPSFGAEKAKQLSSFFKRLIKTVKTSRVCLMIISQVRDKIGVTFGRKHSRTGGHGMDFYASQIIWLSHLKQIAMERKGIKRPFAVLIKAHCDKNKVGMPFRQCEFPIVFGYGVDDVRSCLDWLAEVKRLDVLGLSEAEAKRLSNKAFDSWDRTTYVCETLSPAVRQVWKDIETEFLPKKGKY